MGQMQTDLPPLAAAMFTWFQFCCIEQLAESMGCYASLGRLAQSYQPLKQVALIRSLFCFPSPLFPFFFPLLEWLNRVWPKLSIFEKSDVLTTVILCRGRILVSLFSRQYRDVIWLYGIDLWEHQLVKWTLLQTSQLAKELGSTQVSCSSRSKRDSTHDTWSTGECPGIHSSKISSVPAHTVAYNCIDCLLCCSCNSLHILLTVNWYMHMDIIMQPFVIPHYWFCSSILASSLKQKA